MSRTAMWLISFVLVGSAAFARGDEFVLEGRPVKEWLGQLRLDDGFIAPASETVSESVAEDIVDLLTTVDGKSPRVIDSLQRALGVKSTRALAARLLARMVRSAFELRQEPAGKRALAALGSEAMVKVAVPLLGDANHQLRGDVCRLLCAAGSGGNQAVSALVRGLSDKAWPGRFMAAEPLGRIGGDTALRALIAAVQDKDDLVARSAVDAIGQIGPKAARAVPALIKALQAKRPKRALPLGVLDVGPKLQAKAAYALARIGRAAEGALPVLTRAAESKREDLRKAAAHALKAIRSELADQ